MNKGIIFIFTVIVATNFAGSQVLWEKLTKNPVVRVWSGNVDDPSKYMYVYAPSVMGPGPSGTSGSGYRMWFASAAFGASTYNLSYAASPDGFDWFFYSRNPVLSVGTPGSFDSRWVIDPCVIKVNNEYRLYYTGYNGNVYQTGLATSGDGIHWTKYSGNPILAVVPGTWESVNANGPRVYYDGTLYRMMYSGGNGSEFNIGYATSTDGIHWARYESNPVLRKGDPGTWDQVGVVTNSLVVHEGRIYFFYYAFGGPMGVAISTDWIHWEKYCNNPVFLPGPSGSWDAALAYGSALLENNVFRYWYTGMGGGSGWQVGYATSPLVYPADRTVPGQGQTKTYDLSESYPNPFNPEVTLYYTLASPQHVSIKVYDALGQEVATLADEVKPEGAYTVVWNARDAASGVYWCRMVAGSYTQTRKMILTK